MTREFISIQKQYFEKPEVERFYWQTQNPYISSKEKELLRIIAGNEFQNGLEVGCGEAANIITLKSLGNKSKITGVDFSLKKIEFCLSHKIEDTSFICASGDGLPFKDDHFDLVFCRDLLHHTDNNYKVLSEMVRVCKPGKKMIIIEGNGRKFTNLIFRILVPAESGMKYSTSDNIKDLMRRCSNVKVVSLFFAEPSNIFRILLHYRFGIPQLSKIRIFVSLLNLVDLITKLFIPKWHWAYIIAVGEKIGGEKG